jgi:ClpP class serine protease
VAQGRGEEAVAEIDDQTLIFADVGEKAIKQLRESVIELLTRSQTLDKAKELAGLLATGTWTHDYPITVEEAQRLGLKVSAAIPAEFLQLMSLYPQPVRKRPSVEYLPIPRRAHESRPSDANRYLVSHS